MLIELPDCQPGLAVGHQKKEKKKKKTAQELSILNNTIFNLYVYHFQNRFVRADPPCCPPLGCEIITSDQTQSSINQTN